MSTSVSVISAGGWGTALASHLTRKGYEVTLWAREPEVVASITNQNLNPVFLPDVPLPDGLHCTNDLEAAVPGRDVVLVVTPSQFMRHCLQQIAKYIAPDARVVLAAKGIETDTLQLMHEVANDTLPATVGERLCVLSGPTFAREIARGTPSAAVVAGHDADSRNAVQTLLSSSSFRLYTSDDVLGVELGGALKNVVALAVGILEGAGQGKNTQAALMTRAIAELSRLVTVMGGDPFTVTGLSGVGDLILTCTGGLSRNRQVGIRLGRGESLDHILAGMKMIAEGVETSRSGHHLARKHNVDMPIIETVYRVLHEGADITTAFLSLMERQLTKEFYPLP